MSSIRLEIAVRRTPRFIRSDTKTTELVTALVAADIDAEHAPDTRVERRLAVAVSGFQSHAQEVAELAAVARAQATADDFFRLLRTPGKFASRRRLDHLVDMVAVSLASAPDGSGTVEHRCWSLLRRLWVIQTQLETGHEDMWTAVVDDLKRVAIDGSPDRAVALRDRLEQLAGEFSSHAGVVDAALLRRRLHGEIAPDAHTPPPGWTRLAAIDREARSAVARSVAWSGSSGLTLPRTVIRDDVRTMMAVEGDLVVQGESGVGKSALVMDAIEQEGLGAQHQALAVNLRHLPSRHADLLTLLLSPLAELLAELTAPDSMLIIDSAEAAAETHGDIFVHLVRAARQAGVKVIAITTTEGAATVTELMKQSGEALRQMEIPGLDDEELREAARSVPALQRLVDNARARELLRRPIVIDLLCRSGDPGLPLSEAQALEHIWHHLVRNQNRRNEGAPDAREQVMLRLADHAVSPGDVDSLLLRLDHSAVDGLRRSGLLLPASRLPWERVPAFQHDLVRAYAVARLLLAERDPASALTVRGAPRWTLPSARLACEILLAAPDDPRHPRSGRLPALQQTFEALVRSGYGERWSDVPTEAALAVPDAGDVLHDAWPSLAEEDGLGVARLIRVLRARHERDGVVDPVVAEPVVARLLEPNLPRDLSRPATSLIGDWLRAHVIHGSPAGQATRLEIRAAILRRCADKERALDAQEAARQAELDARTPEQVAADDARHQLFAALTASGPSGRHRRRRAARHRPYQWIDDTEIEHLALLGHDLGPDGEEILRRVANDEPHYLEHAVEALFAGNALAAHDPKLLLDLAEAYYIEREDEDEEDELGWSSGLREDGIRDHSYRGLGPLASFIRGPFLAMFRADYRGGVALLNRMLDHAARCRVRDFTSRGSGHSALVGHTLSITGEPREYAGDEQVWLWYRGTGVGPYPCMSALQALEFVTEEYIKAGIPAEELTSLMTAEAHSLAMPALALAVLVRHLEDVGDAIDPYLVEPTVWQLEFSCSTSDRTSGLAAQVPNLPHPDRRSWTLREVAMTLVLAADSDRIRQLKDVGNRLEDNARNGVGDASSPAAREHLAAVRTWAAALDPAAYEVRREDDRVVIQQSVDPDAQRVLADTNADLRRTNDALGLVVRHAHPRHNGGHAPDIAPDALVDDLALARDLLDDPPRSAAFSPDGPVAVAATAIELHLTSRASVPLDDLHWAAALLLSVAAAVADRPPEAYDDSFFDQGADRSAARALPYLLLPAARELRTALGVDGADDVDELIALSRGVAVSGDNETRLAYARALDPVWAAPCDPDHLHGRCHHRVAFDLVTDSAAESVIGPWDPRSQRRPLVRLDPPRPQTLDTIRGDDIYVRRLSPALRAAGAAAATTACSGKDARLALPALLAAHQRGMLARNHGYHHSHSDSLVAARAALRQAVAGDDETVLQYIRGYLPSSRLLAEGLQALAAAAEERSDAGRHARRLWPQVMDLVLDAARERPELLTQHNWGDYAQAHLIPNPTAAWGYLTIELAGDPYPWRDLRAWRPQLERWLGEGATRRMSIDHLVIAVRDLEVRDQIDYGLPWIEQAVSGSGSDCASTFTLPEWLRERRPDLRADEDIARWQRVVDRLVVAGDTRVADLAD